MVAPIVVNIWKEGSNVAAYNGVSWAGETKIVTILVQDKGLEEVITKNTKPLRWAQPSEPDPKTKVFDLHLPPIHTFEITGILDKVHQVLTTSSVSAGASVSIPVEKSSGFTTGDITIVSPDGTLSETATITSIPDDTHIVVDSLSNNYPSNSIVSRDLDTNPKDDLLAIIADKGCANLIYRGTTYNISFNKISLKDVGPIKEQYAVKVSVYEGEELL